jgi:ketosteroid isomerase-like protein
MSQEDVEIVRTALGNMYAFMRGELSREALAEFLDPQVEAHWRDQQTYPDTPQNLRGIPAILDFSEQYRRTWADLAAEPLELIEAPRDRVVASISQSGRGRESGVPIEIHFFEVFTIRAGKVREMEFFRHRTDAMEAAGLPNQ